MSACSSVQPRQALYMNYLNIDGGGDFILYIILAFLNHIVAMEV